MIRAPPPTCFHFHTAKMQHPHKGDVPGADLPATALRVSGSKSRAPGTKAPAAAKSSPNRRLFVSRTNAKSSKPLAMDPTYYLYRTRCQAQ